MEWTWPVSAFAVIVAVLVVTMKLLKSQQQSFQNQLEWMRQEHREQRIVWEQERERLLNRSMTKEWSSYAQMQSWMQGSFGSASEEFVPGMSDEEELIRIGRATADSQELGEILVELGDLGLRAE